MASGITSDFSTISLSIAGDSEKPSANNREEKMKKMNGPIHKEPEFCFLPDLPYTTEQHSSKFSTTFIDTKAN